MSSEAMRVDVCIATFRRPGQLRRLLESLAGQRFDDPTAMRIIVVDNDSAESARETVAAFAELSPWPVLYDVEPVRNISLTRNRAVSHALGEYLAFIDDDEFAAEDWLREMISACRRYGADAVFGPVIPVLPEDAPEWVKKGRFFERPRHRSGAALKMGGAGNMVVRTARIASYAIPFDPACGLSGGEDGDLCLRIRRHKGKLVWCDTGVVHENIEPERTTVRYLARRSLCGGQVYALRTVPGRGLSRNAVWFCSRSMILAASFAVMIVSWPVRRYWGVRWLRKVCSNLGQLSILTRYRYRLYANN